jgi:hypothetical protein
VTAETALKSALKKRSEFQNKDILIWKLGGNYYRTILTAQQLSCSGGSKTHTYW